MITEYDIQKTIEAIKAEWQKPVRAFIRTGELLKELQEAVGHGNWMPLFDKPDGDLAYEFNIDKAEQLIKISEDIRLTENSEIFRNLPRAYTTLYELTKYTLQQLEEALTLGLLRPDATLREIRDFREAPRRTGLLGCV